jgi:hypothetical protein
VHDLLDERADDLTDVVFHDERIEDLADAITKRAVEHRAGKRGFRVEEEEDPS